MINLYIFILNIFCSSFLVFDFEVMSKLDYGKAVVRFSTSAVEIFKEYGEIPLPLYTKGRDFEGNRYQTIYASDEGSAAVPTAGKNYCSPIGKQKRKIIDSIVLGIACSNIMFLNTS